MFPTSTRWLLLALGLCLSTAVIAGLPPSAPFSPAAQALIDRAFSDLDPARPLIDVHVHALGLGQDGDGTFVNPEKLSARHPLKRLETGLYLKATGVKGLDHFDRDYVEVLLARARAFPRPVRIHLLAMDRAYKPDGTPDPIRTEFHVPNAYVLDLAARHPDLITPVISIHPARKDAIQELEACAARGARLMKWLPNAQAIDPANPAFDPFYRRMKELGVVLLTHAGEEKAVAVKGAQALGNPLRLRRPLDLGVTVIVAHCASLGRNEDLDHPGTAAPNFELFLRLMNEPRYQGHLFGDLSAITQINRLPAPLQHLLAHPEFDGRLLNGSDYPLPGVDLVIWTRQLVKLGMLTPNERQALNEIWKRNPLLFDVVLKRTLKDPSTGRRWPADLFQRDPGSLAGKGSAGLR
ncbi:amidohydrolase family protein [Geothrix sp. PMB-07]|uniref:amidohydrolase family protein n=1 Tax=Geothrix sp. PMB-07 TaxID=3068640 RepID=UPI002740ED7E|nr:amidohydrolase family protein [Geothrix sp. PMB-07]WLT32178.1 amidohydrolase family protein [Geothrix sp. PMB-07]